MGYRIKNTGGRYKWCIRRGKGTRNLVCFKTKRKAKAAQKALNAGGVVDRAGHILRAGAP